MRPRKKTHLDTRLAACSAIMVAPAAIQKGAIQSFFPSVQPLHLEIGCGKGQFICTLAQQNPHINFVAMEREPSIIVMAAERATAMQLTNIRFLLDDAKYLSERFAPGEINRIYINFCDPWHKRRQTKRRLTYRSNLVTYQALLCECGELWFKTDNEPLYRFSLGEFRAVMPAYFTTEDLHASKYAAENIMTEYETHFSSLGQPIFSIRSRCGSAVK